MTAWEILDFFQRGIKLLWTLSLWRQRLPLNPFLIQLHGSTESYSFKEIVRKGCSVYSRLFLNFVNTWVKFVWRSNGAFFQPQVKIRSRKWSHYRAAGSMCFNVLSTDLHLKRFLKNFPQKCLLQFSAGGELHNPDKRFVLTFPTPVCQSNTCN